MKVFLKVSMEVSLKVREGGQVVVFVSGEKNGKEAAFGKLSAQMRGTGVERASRVTCESRRKDASTEQPKTSDAAGFW
jgi:replicative superfamily II helicase